MWKLKRDIPWDKISVASFIVYLLCFLALLFWAWFYSWASLSAHV